MSHSFEPVDADAIGMRNFAVFIVVTDGRLKADMVRLRRNMD
jgi:hypothetical protein